MKTLAITLVISLLGIKAQAQNINCDALKNIDSNTNTTNIKDIYSSELITINSDESKNSIVSEQGIKLTNGFRATSTENQAYLVTIGNCEIMKNKNNTENTTLSATKEEVEFSQNTNISSIFPNPAINEITISWGTETVKSITILNVEGKVVQKIEKSSISETKVDISALTNGIYLTVIEDSTKTEVIKFIKN